MDEATETRGAWRMWSAGHAHEIFYSGIFFKGGWGFPPQTSLQNGDQKKVMA